MSFAEKKLNYKKPYFVKYHPELKKIFGSQEAVLIFQKSEYWFQMYPSGFWKFFEPCEKHPQYREGDSWQEELGFSRKVFKRVFSALGIHYKSKSEYLARSDPFQGKLYASYYDRKTNQTYFLRNHQEVQQFLSSFWQGVKNIAAKVISKISQTGSSRNVSSGSSFVRALDISLQRSTSSCDTQQPIVNTPIQANIAIPDKIPSTASDQPLATKAEDEIDKNIKIAKDMLEIWNNITINKQTLRSDLKIKLPQALLESFQGSLKLWTNFCLKVASSKFLMGEAPNSNFKAYLAWLIKSETIEAIEDGYYSLGDRQVRYHSTHVKTQQTFSRNEVEGTESWKDVCEQLCNKLGYATFRSWFKDLKFFHEETSQPTLHCPTRFMRDWVQTHYQRDLERIVKQVLPHTTNLTIGIGL